ncbi:MAG: PIG-L family deacetylase [Solirubrobacterales bacterium]
MFIVAHQDDDLLFQSPDVLEAIAAGDCVETVFLTAGDAGLGTAYWQEREAGSRAAYAVMAGVPDAWTNFERTVSGHLVHGAALTGNPDVSEVYLRLPNGGSTGSGYAATGFKSLPRLWRSQNPQPASLTPISELTALDGSATYTYNGLLATLQALIAEFEPDVIATQEFTREFGTGDHADHVATAKLARIAADAYGPKHILLGFMDYNTQNQPVNVFEPVLAQKLSAYYAYAAHDSNEACSTLLQCEQPLFSSYYAWQRRQYITAETSVPGANAGANQAVASGAGVTLDGSKSADPLGHSLSFHWAQTGGTAVTLSSKTAVKPTFTAPVGPATLTFSLTVESSEATSSPATVTVNVAKPFYALKVTKSGNGQGTVTSSPAGISCGADCEESYESGKEVTSPPRIPAAGSGIQGLERGLHRHRDLQGDDLSGEGSRGPVLLERHQLSVTRSGTGTGSLTSSPAGISCGGFAAPNSTTASGRRWTPSPRRPAELCRLERCLHRHQACEVTSAASGGCRIRPDPHL